MFSFGKVYLPLKEQGKDRFIDAEVALMLITSAVLAVACRLAGRLCNYTVEEEIGEVEPEIHSMHDCMDMAAAMARSGVSFCL